MSGASSPSPPPAAVGGGKAPLSAAGKVGIIAGAVAVLGLLYWMGTGPSGPARPADDLGGAQGAAGATRRIALPPPENLAPVPVAAPPQPGALPGMFSSPPRVQRPEKIRASPIMAWEDKADGGGRMDAAAAAGRADGGPAEDELGERLRATRTEAARARRVRDRDLVLTKGSIIPCVRRTPINTQLPGLVRCYTSDAVFSQSGNVELLPAHTKITGQIQRAMMQGTNRAFVLWTTAETPDGTTIELDSPGADAMGQAGVAVDVNTNFWARFGGAIMLSFIDAGLQAAALTASNALQPGGDGQRLNFYQLQSGGRNAAARALDATVNVPPFGTAPQGEAEAVFLARDLDFTPVYRLRRTGQ